MLLFMDGFDHYTLTAAKSVGKWTVTNEASGSITSTAARFGTGAGLRMTNHSLKLVRPFTASSQTLIAGFAMNVVGVGGGGGFPVVSLSDAGTTQLDLLFVGSSRNFQFRRGTTTIGSTYTLPNDGKWHYIEVKLKIANSISSGDVVLRVDGVDQITLAAATDTQQTANSTFDSFFLIGGASQSGYDIYFDDFYLIDTTGSLNNTFLGEMRVITALPNANGNSSQYVGSDSNSTDNYLLVDDADPNSDTDYVEDSTVGNRDLYGFADISSGGIKGLQLTSFARKTDAGARDINLSTRISSTNYDSSAYTLPSSYAHVSNIWETSPATASVWTQSEVNGAEFGIRTAT